MITYIDKTHAKLTVSLGSRGNRKRYSKTVEITGKKDAQRQYLAFEQEIKGGIESTMTVEELLTWYIDNSSVRSTTSGHAYRCASKPIISYFKGRKASEVTTYHIERFISSEAKNRSNKTIKNEVSLLSSAYKRAIRLNLLKDNPCEKAQLPKVQKAEIRTLDEEGYKAFTMALAKEQNLDFKVAVELALFCGLRMSEILALTKEDINTNFLTVSVSKSRHRQGGKDIVQEPKTATSYRTIAMPRFMADDILALYESHIFDTEYIIQNGFGEPATQNFIRKHMIRFIEENDLPDIRMHGLRHTHASMLISNGMGVAEVSKQLGHAQVSTTLNVYTHEFASANSASRKAAEMFSQKWGSNGTPKEQIKNAEAL